MRSVSALLLACALALPARAAAQDTARTTPPTAGQMAAARELLEAMRMLERAAVEVRVAIDQQIGADPQLAPYRATIHEWGREIVSSEEAKAAFATLYASAFSEADLRQLAAFFRTPLGQRFASSQAALTEKGAEIGRSLASARQADLMARIQRITPKP